MWRNMEWNPSQVPETGKVHLTIYTHSRQKQTDNFEEIFQAKALLAKYLREKCWSEHY